MNTLRHETQTPDHATPGAVDATRSVSGGERRSATGASGTLDGGRKLTGDLKTGVTPRGAPANGARGMVASRRSSDSRRLIDHPLDFADTRRPLAGRRSPGDAGEHEMAAAGVAPQPQAFGRRRGDDIHIAVVIDVGEGDRRDRLGRPQDVRVRASDECDRNETARAFAGQRHRTNQPVGAKMTMVAFSRRRSDGEKEAEQGAEQKPSSLHTSTIARASPTVKRLRMRWKPGKAAVETRKPNSVPLVSPSHACARDGNAARDNDHSSSPVITDGIQQPTRRRRTGRPLADRESRGADASLFGLAPCGVLPAIRVATDAVRSYRTFSPLPFALRARPSRRRSARGAVCFLCHCPSSCPDRALPGALPCGVRTFLPAARPA